jgi:hypothetical protein
VHGNSNAQFGFVWMLQDVVATGGVVNEKTGSL